MISSVNLALRDRIIMPFIEDFLCKSLFTADSENDEQKNLTLFNLAAKFSFKIMVEVIESPMDICLICLHLMYKIYKNSEGEAFCH